MSAAKLVTDNVSEVMTTGGVISATLVGADNETSMIIIVTNNSQNDYKNLRGLVDDLGYNDHKITDWRIISGVVYDKRNKRTLKSYCFIFGSRPVKIIEGEGWDAFIEMVKKEKGGFDGDVHIYSWDTPFSEVLSDYDGWDGWAEITNDQYSELESILTEIKN